MKGRNEWQCEFCQSPDRRFPPSLGCGLQSPEGLEKLNFVNLRNGDYKERKVGCDNATASS